MSRDGFAVSHCTHVMDSIGDGWGLLFRQASPEGDTKGLPRPTLLLSEARATVRSWAYGLSMGFPPHGPWVAAAESC